MSPTIRMLPYNALDSLKSAGLIRLVKGLLDEARAKGFDDFELVVDEIASDIEVVGTYSERFPEIVFVGEINHEQMQSGKFSQWMDKVESAFHHNFPQEVSRRNILPI